MLGCGQRCGGNASLRFVDRYRNSLTWPQVKVLRAIQRCRTAALGGHRDQCDRCGPRAISYNSCRDRHCPKCQTNARNRWLAARQRELLPAGGLVLRKIGDGSAVAGERGDTFISTSQAGGAL
jgi:Transposase zinc-binding domain